MLLEALAAIGYPPPVAEELRVWEAARFLGADENDPTIVGSRGVVLKSDDEGPNAANPKEPWETTLARAEMDPSQRGGSSISGEDW